MLRLAFLLPLPALFSALSWGAQSPELLSGSDACVSALQGRMQVTVNVLDEKLSEAEVEEMVGVVRDIEARLRGVMSIPDAIKLDLQRTHHHYGAFTGTNLIAAALMPTFSYSPEPQFGKACLAHEFGHLLLNHALKERGAQFTQRDSLYLSRIQRLARLKQEVGRQANWAIGQAESALKAGKRLEASVWGKTYLRRLGRQDSLQGTIDRLQREMSSAYESTLGPYDEFFADLIAVIYSQDGRIISETLATSADDSTNVEVVHRDFTAALRTDLGIYASELRADFVRAPRASQWQHTALGAARRHLWHRHLARAIHDRDATARIVRGVLNAIFAETERAAASFRPGDPRPHEAELNRGFIQVLDRELGP